MSREVNEIFKNEGNVVANTHDVQEQVKGIPVKELVKSVIPHDAGETENRLMQLLKAAREKSISITVGKDYGMKTINIMIAVILHLVCEEILRVIELIKNDKVIKIYVIGTEIVESILYKQLDKNCEDSVFIKKCKYGKKADMDHEIIGIGELFKKLEWAEHFRSYCQKWMPEIIGGNRLDEENRKEAARLFERLLPITNEKGQLLLAEDQNGNQILAFVKRHNESGNYTFGVFRKGADGRVGKSITIGADEVVTASTKVRKKIQSAEGTFTAQNATEGMQRLWLWNLSRKFSYVEEPDDYAPSDIHLFLKDWIRDNVGTKFKTGNDVGEETEPVFVGKIKDNYLVGIWSDSLQQVFDELELRMRAKDWISEAAKEGWIQRYAVALQDGKENYRRAYNPSMAQREEFQRENKSERIYIFDFSDVQAQILYDKRAAMKLAGTVNDEEKDDDK